MMTPTITIPEALPTWNKFYAGKHWTTRTAIVEKWRALTLVAISGKAIQLPRPFPVDINIVVYNKTDRRRDADNICAKLLIDGFKAHGLIPDDDGRYISTVSTSHATGGHAKPRTEVVFTLPG